MATNISHLVSLLLSLLLLLLFISSQVGFTEAKRDQRKKMSSPPIPSPLIPSPPIPPPPPRFYVPPSKSRRGKGP
ncbi:unnamed protein product [Arabidopsis thaliana]|uniref:Transmembrane protein n=1 Tax=Arabidopsis thaliana TaxID=3702 RepID=A0A654G5Y1_ARATH|nr:unnamed protein product [Arabidopsis thaliana]